MCKYQKQNIHFSTILPCYKVETLTKYTTELLLKVIGNKILPYRSYTEKPFLYVYCKIVTETI